MPQLDMLGLTKTPSSKNAGTKKPGAKNPNPASTGPERTLSGTGQVTRPYSAESIESTSPTGNSGVQLPDVSSLNMSDNVTADSTTLAEVNPQRTYSESKTGSFKKKPQESTPGGVSPVFSESESGTGKLVKMQSFKKAEDVAAATPEVVYAEADKLSLKSVSMKSFKVICMFVCAHLCMYVCMYVRMHASP